MSHMVSDEKRSVQGSLVFNLRYAQSLKERSKYNNIIGTRIVFATVIVNCINTFGLKLYIPKLLELLAERYYESGVVIIQTVSNSLSLIYIDLENTRVQ